MCVWDDSYSIGIAEIDQQHQSLFAIVRRLRQAVRSGQSESHIEPVLNDLVKFCDLHFTVEESLMMAHQFPGLPNHRSEHGLIRSQVQLFLQEHRAQKPGLVFELMEYLEDWLDIHILQHDMKYRDHLLQHWGVQFRTFPQQDDGPSAGIERRRTYRFGCSLALELRQSPDAPIIYGQCINISHVGAYVKSWSPLPANTLANARFILENKNAEMRVCVRRSEPCVGMGISFLGTLPGALVEFLAKLKKAQAENEKDELDCKRLLHSCLQNIAALEDVISESGTTQDTAAAVHFLVSRAHRLENLTEKNH